ncbi:hypothetical protein MMC13_000788 [Lambiella insularis]|nr:hypothetical protein [Lambiella insularis]
MPPKSTSTVLAPTRLPPLPKLRVRRPNRPETNPCLGIMTSMLGCWASSGRSGSAAQACVALEQQLRTCMDAPVRLLVELQRTIGGDADGAVGGIETEAPEEEYHQLPSLQALPEDHWATQAEVRRAGWWWNVGMVSVWEEDSDTYRRALGILRIGRGAIVHQCMNLSRNPTFGGAP